MGFFSKLMKNPLVQMALPMAMSWAIPQLGIAKLFSGIKTLCFEALLSRRC